jgi:cytochrome d ubiquinol oxidase subunit I
MDVLDLARWQFGVTTVYHFIFVPLTIGLGPCVAIMQTLYHRRGDERWLRLTRFFGALLLINFAIGVVTGIVQEFQFGMTWSEYSRFVGDVFGAPLAMEALIAFFAESVFLGLWVFGWKRLPQRIHLASIWGIAIASNISAFFILAANSWMQHPVGTVYNEATGRAELDSIWTVITSPTTLSAFAHTITAAFVVTGTFITGIAVWWMVRSVRSSSDVAHAEARNVYRPAVVFGAVVLLIGGAGVALSGDHMGRLMYVQQPAKMAAAEAICEDTPGAAFTLAVFGPINASCEELARFGEIPGVASFLSTHSWDITFPGTTQIQAASAVAYPETNPDGSDVNYIPNVMVTFWSFRLMIGLAVFSAVLALWALWSTRSGRVSDNPWLKRLALVAIPAPFIACSFGWIFTEMGRQPWVVTPNPSGIDSIRLLTARGVSTSVPPWVVLTSMIAFTLVYAVLAVIWFRLMHRYTIEGVAPLSEHDVAEADDAATTALSFAY